MRGLLGAWTSALLALLLPAAAVADAVVLIPGYLGHGHLWREQGVTPALVASGWEDGGNLLPGPAGPRFELPPRGGRDRFYTAELPSEAPLPLQLAYLTAYVEAVRRLHEGEPLVLVGHSAGGVLGRLLMVTRPDLGVDTLVTIASPHVGSAAAEFGQFLGDTPLSWFAPWVGLGTLNRSQGLYRDLGRPEPWSLLGRLNLAPHPQARYLSVVRPEDDWVEPWSQDMNRVPALAGRGEVLLSAGGHGLHPGDGALLAWVLRARGAR